VKRKGETKETRFEKLMKLKNLKTDEHSLRNSPIIC